MTFLAAAFFGTAVGGLAADRYVLTKPRALFLVPGLCIFSAILFVLAAIYGRGESATFGGLFFAEGMIVLQHGALLRHHRVRRDAQHARRGIRGRPWRPCIFWATSGRQA